MSASNVLPQGQYCPLGDHPDDVSAWNELHCVAKDKWRNESIVRRIIGYLRGALKNGAELQLSCLIQRAFAKFCISRSERMVRYYMHEIKKSDLFIITKHRIGRSFCLLIRKQGAKKSAKIHPAITTIRSLKGVKINAKPTAGCCSSLRNLAWSVGRMLGEQHWDNCKVRFDLRHAFNFAFRWLKDGRLFDDIRDTYSKALHVRHKDATDYDLDNGQNLVKWEPSSTVSLANTMMKQSREYSTWYGLMSRKLSTIQTVL